MKIFIAFTLCLLLLAPNIQAQMQEEEYDDLYFVANDRKLVAKNALIKAQQREERLKLEAENPEIVENKQQVQSRRSLHFNHNLAPEARFFGNLNRPQLTISFGNGAWANSYGSRFYDPYNSFNSNFYDPYNTIDPWGRSNFYRNGWNTSSNWMWGNRNFNSNYYGNSYYNSGLCPNSFNSGYTTSYVANNEIQRDTRKVYKGTRNTRNSGVQFSNSGVSQSNVDLSNGRSENTRSRTTPNYTGKKSSDNSWGNNNRNSGNIFNSGSNKKSSRSNNSIYNNSGSNNNRSSSFGNSNRSRSSNNNRSSGGGNSGGRSRSRN